MRHWSLLSLISEKPRPSTPRMKRNPCSPDCAESDNPKSSQLSNGWSRLNVTTSTQASCIGGSKTWDGNVSPKGACRARKQANSGSRFETWRPSTNNIFTSKIRSCFPSPREFYRRVKRSSSRGKWLLAVRSRLGFRTLIHLLVGGPSRRTSIAWPLPCILERYAIISSMELP